MQPGDKVFWVRGASNIVEVIIRDDPDRVRDDFVPITLTIGPTEAQGVALLSVLGGSLFATRQEAEAELVLRILARR